MKFSILVPAYNEEQSISSCLNSLISVVYDDKEIIVIDNESTDKTANMAREQGVKVIPYQNNPKSLNESKNFGFSKRNREPMTKSACPFKMGSRSFG